MHRHRAQRGLTGEPQTVRTSTASRRPQIRQEPTTFAGPVRTGVERKV
jgi:hypothetical protein